MVNILGQTIDIPFIQNPFTNNNQGAVPILQKNWNGWVVPPSGTSQVGNAGTSVADATPDSGAYTSAGGTSAGSGTTSSAPAYNPADLAYLNDQQSRLQSQQGSTNTALQNGLTSLLDSYNQSVNGANTNESRAMQDLATKSDDTERAKNTALNTVDTNAKTLADSLRSRIGMESGANSSAYQLAAPHAVANQASDQRNGVETNYGQNFRDLATTKDRETQDFATQLQDLLAQKNSKESDFRSGILNQQNQIDQSLSEVARQRALLLGGGYNQVQSALAPYTQQIDSRQSQIDNLFNQFRTPYNVTPVDTTTPQLRDYITTPGQIQAPTQTADTSVDPFAQALVKKQQDVNPLN